MFCEMHYRKGPGEKPDVIRVATIGDQKRIIEMCGRNGFEVLKNPMCNKCVRDGCNGTYNFVWTGCIYREVYKR